jgi:membrane carboxypeptidase/penicillin-binding protein PbpC
LEWFVDGASVGTADPDTPLRWPLSRGAHAITVRDASGHATSTSIVVR